MRNIISKLLKQNGHNITIGDLGALERSMQSPNGKVRCLVVNEPTAIWGYRYVDPTMLPQNSIPVVDGELTYLLNFDGQSLALIDYAPADNEDKAPQDCYEAQCWDELEVVLGLGMSTATKVSLGILVGVVIALLVVVFLISMVAMGG